MSITKLGFNDWFQNKVDPGKSADLQIARVITVNKDNYTINNGRAETVAEITGKLIFKADSPLDYPAVGDWVYTQYFDEGFFAIIHDILPRKSLLKRKTPGKKIDFQLIAANIDTALIMQSLDENYNLRRLERYLVMIYNSEINPLVLLSKSDLATPDEIENKRADIRNVMPDVQVVAFSNNDDADLERMNQLLISEKTYCLLGSSGVGKTTLLNNLLHEERFDTQAIREKDGRGRHTTARRQLIVLENGSMIIDTPGMRELGNMDIETGLSDTFGEIAALAGDCRFNDCTHTQEEGCTVLAALKEGIISQERYQNYLKMKKESAYYDRSYLEKRQRDKEFGKMYKSVMKHKKKKS
ncbi:MAG: ribosome small subunit-dependent GTPase A [Calditrichia bacterium]|nr:ribosome small subunit-dependent GTPase A [Calditrichia bacterium]